MADADLRFLVRQRHRSLTGTSLYRLVTEARACEQLAQGCYLKAERAVVEPVTFESQVQHRSNYTQYTARPHATFKCRK